ncbi:MAG: Imidazolonepropionase [Thermotoga sp. 50_1627]|uniref:imidazolonepropionase n=1 Tax=Pseudothermotoga sp. TaxID=2033661 RepID=UPI00076C5ABA|nr:MAG: Imidazolonepropionase [Thermotoga sp. 50_64]KUK25137.1 MAG: Imidazolonepropionase [Thermotoga sp. 50_1627]MBC7115679.1 imidazolonepropionase [Pseudothermotoga sp.]MDK2923751.1 imidazolonepropionase [Pseudothermotoga sp.]HBT38512.1 imidazolonepropionase [Pseudothermotoga sp.]
MIELVVAADKLCTPKGNGPKSGQDMSRVELLEGVYIWIESGKIVEISTSKPKSFARFVTAGLVVPGFVDCHTHIPFYGFRENDFLKRVGGATYLQLHSSGGGLFETVEKVRKASERDLLKFNLRFLRELLKKGVTTVECKSGYGLDRENELKQLNVIDKLSRIVPQDIVCTFLGAHAVPKGLSESEYVDQLINVLDEVKNYTNFVDIFCEVGAFNVESARTLLMKASEKGFKLRMHADEISNIGASRLAAELKAVSADHLLKIDEDAIRALASSGTIAVLMPSTSFHLNETYAPARKLIESNVPVAIASDFNPGSSPTLEPTFVMHLAVRYLKMSPEEVLTAYTLNAASVLGLSERLGTVEVGKQADLVLYDEASLLTLPYLIGLSPKAVVKRGQVFEN